MIYSFIFIPILKFLHVSSSSLQIPLLSTLPKPNVELGFPRVRNIWWHSNATCHDQKFSTQSCTLRGTTWWDECGNITTFTRHTAKYSRKIEGNIDNIPWVSERARDAPKGRSPEGASRAIERTKGILSISPRFWGNIVAVAEGTSWYRHYFYFLTSATIQYEFQCKYWRSPLGDPFNI